MFDRAAAWVQTPGNVTLRRTGWGPAVLKKIQKVATKLPPVGGKGPVSFAPLTGNMVPLVMLHQLAPAKEVESEAAPVPEPQSFEYDPDALVSSTGVKCKRKRVVASAGGRGRRRSPLMPLAPTPRGVGQGR